MLTTMIIISFVVYIHTNNDVNKATCSAYSFDFGLGLVFLFRVTMFEMYRKNVFNF